ncbi:SMI1/KNR4 family protein [Streptomyces sp. CC208A]|uniref:SMI1/KNR4 family protein n=1 Tax=Streptomyces sp. CC208A TaxID=3044573 RepID=UPI0024A8DA48|nr:SMI1/KNR4 family protein [Streptomyces sp. CC208A]
MTDSIARLLDIAPAPGAPRPKDWGEIECGLGCGLPTDYKKFIHLYGGGHWDEYLYVLEPGCPNVHYDLVTWARCQAEDLQDLWEFERKPVELEAEGARVVPWATTDNGECLYWLVHPGLHPDHWTVMVNEARGERWEHFPVSCTRFLASCLDGELRSGLLSSSFPLAVHEFRGLGAA